jgi:hypothetical protein
VKHRDEKQNGDDIVDLTQVGIGRGTQVATVGETQKSTQQSAQRAVN